MLTIGISTPFRLKLLLNYWDWDLDPDYGVKYSFVLADPSKICDFYSFIILHHDQLLSKY